MLSHTDRIANKLSIVIIVFGLLFFSSTKAQSTDPENVLKTMKLMADWQIEHFNDSLFPCHNTFDWTNGALYVGMVKWANIATSDKYWQWLYKIGKENNWKPGKRKYHADDHAVGQLYCELYHKYNNTGMIKQLQSQFDYIIYHPSQSKLDWRTPFHHDRWNWCDALFMSPPVWAKLYNITGDKKYLDFMFKEYQETTNFLFDKNDHLFYRDQRYRDKLNNCKQQFWSRGNGWVFAGLANILPELEPGSKEYKYFLKLFKKMAKKFKEIQTPQGFWAMSLLEQDLYPTPETSGTSFIVFGLAWGINNNILDYESYEPSVRKGWNALNDCVNKNGMLGYVQPIGAAPGEAWPDKTEVYGTGAFLCAGAEVYMLYSKKLTR